MNKSKSIILPLVVAIAISGLVGYLIGVYKVIKSDTTVQILDAAHLDIRPTLIRDEELESGVNQERIKLGLSPLAHNDLLYRSACNKLDDMVNKGYWSHDAPDGTKPWAYIEQAGYRYRTAGENLAYGFKTSEDTLKGWMNSPTHKANIVGDYTEQGMCSKVVKFQGNYFNLTVNHFGSPY